MSGRGTQLRKQQNARELRAAVREGDKTHVVISWTPILAAVEWKGRARLLMERGVRVAVVRTADRMVEEKDMRGEEGFCTSGTDA